MYHSGEDSSDEQNEWVQSEEEEEEDDKWMQSKFVLDVEDEEAEGDWDPNSEFVGKDYKEHFTTDLEWDSKEELYKWVKEKGKELVIALVKRNSNPYQISIVCDRFGSWRSGRQKVNKENPELSVPKIRKSRSKKCGCKFEIMGVRKKKKAWTVGEKWMLGVIEGRHNHKLRTSFEGHAFMGRMTEAEQVCARRWGDGRKMPNQIVSELRQNFSGNVTSRKQVANFLQKLQYEDLGDLTVTQWSIRFMVEQKYIVHPLRDAKTDEVVILFFANPESLRLLKKFPYVIIIDATYKTNKYGMPLVEIVGFTNTHKTFNIAYAFTRTEKIYHYTWIMRKVRALCLDLGVMPTVIMTDYEKALITAIRSVFGTEVQHLLCWVHIKHNIEARASSILKKKESVDAFANQCWALFCSASEESYEERLAVLRTSWKKGLVGYVEDTWLIPYKTSIVRAWTDHHLHFFTRTSNRVEGMHKVLKDIIGSSRGGFNRVIVRIHHAIILQIDQIRGSMNLSLSKRPTDFDDASMPAVVRATFSRLFYQVSDRCFDMLLGYYDMLKTGEFSEECNDHWVRDCLGLPCVHSIARAIISRTPLIPSDVHEFWRDLEWEETPTTTLGPSAYGKRKASASTGRGPGQPENQASASTAVVMDFEDLQSQPILEESQLEDLQWPQEPIFPLVHMGVNFGIDNVDDFWIPYIKNVRDVRSDGHCGYRSMTVLLGRQEHEYANIRREMVAELLNNRELYEPIRCRLQQGSWEDLILQVNHCKKPCSELYWLHMPLMGLVFATLYQVGLVLLTWEVPTFCLPLRNRTSSVGPPDKILAMAHVGNHDHFIPVVLTEGSPIPHTPGVWRRNADRNILWWTTKFELNLKMYRDYRIAYGRAPDPFMHACRHTLSLSV